MRELLDEGQAMNLFALLHERPRESDKVVVVDFDKTIAEDRYPSIGRLMPGVKRALDRLKKAGFKVVIFSCRLTLDPGRPPKEVERQRKAMEEYLRKNDVPFDEIDDGSKGKTHARFYIDDKAIRYNGQEGDWDAICNYILSGAKQHAT